MKKQNKLWGSLVIFLSVTLACNFFSSPDGPSPAPTLSENKASDEIASVSSATPAQPTALDPATAIPTKNSPPAATATPALSPTPAALCSTNGNLKIRSGPGTAYEPPITAVGPDTRLIPFGFNPVGIPGGSWVLVSTEDGAITGWVSASPDFLTCNIDLTTLSPVQVAPPPPTVTPKPTNTPETRGSAPIVSNNGGFGDCPLNLTCESSFSAASLAAENAHFVDSDKNGDGIEYVNFSIWDTNESVKFYERTERTPIYCTFGGDGPCNSWIYENGAFRWSSGSDAVQPGEYVIVTIIKGTTPDENGNSEGQMRQYFSISAP